MDSSIPRVETPKNQIAYIRTKWMNDRHIETVLYDHQDRILEVFNFGRSSSKVLNRYEGKRNPVTIYYYHSDSSDPGYITINTLRRTFNADGRVVVESHVHTSLSGMGYSTPNGFYKRFLAYTATGDTIITRTESSYRRDERDSSQRVNIDRWERDDKNLISRHYRLQVTKGPGELKPDTVYNFSQRFAYDATGKRKLAWFDAMYLWRFYIPEGPDTIWYQYDARNRLVAERHRYTTDMRHKKEIDTTGLKAGDKESIDWYRKKFFVGDSIFHNNDRVDLVRYQYDVFDPAKHLPLAIPGVN